MPFVRILAPQAPSPSTVEHLLSEVVRAAAECLGKSEKAMMVRVEPAAPMALAGSTAPCAYVDVHLIGLPSPDGAAALADALTGLVAAALGVDRARVFVVLTDVPRVQWAVGGRLLA